MNLASLCPSTICRYVHKATGGELLLQRQLGQQYLAVGAGPLQNSLVTDGTLKVFHRTAIEHGYILDRQYA